MEVGQGALVQLGAGELGAGAAAGSCIGMLDLKRSLVADVVRFIALQKMPPKTPAAQDPAPAEAAPPPASAEDADKAADFAPVNMELPDIQSKFATLYTNLEKEQRARYICVLTTRRAYHSNQMRWPNAAS